MENDWWELGMVRDTVEWERGEGREAVETEDETAMCVSSDTMFK